MIRKNIVICLGFTVLGFFVFGPFLMGDIWPWRSPIIPHYRAGTLEYNIEQTINSVVHITNETQGWQGSGVAVTKRIIMTARHVVGGGTDFTITLNNEVEAKATQAISSKKYDLGFIKLDEPILSPAEFGSIEDCRLGQSVFTIGSPFDIENFNSVSLGIISGLNRDYGQYRGWQVAWQIDAATFAGNSGCPVYTLDGIVRGILVGGFGDFESMSYCIPVDLVLEDVNLIKMIFMQDRYFLEEPVEDSQEDWLSLITGPGIGE